MAEHPAVQSPVQQNQSLNQINKATLATNQRTKVIIQALPQLSAKTPYILGF